LLKTNDQTKIVISKSYKVKNCMRIITENEIIDKNTLKHQND